MLTNIKEISKELGIKKKDVEQDLKSGLQKVWDNFFKMYPEYNSFERMKMLGQMFGMTSEEDFAYFFYDFPDEIRLEVLECIKTEELMFKHMDVNDFMNIDKKRMKKLQEES